MIFDLILVMYLYLFAFYVYLLFMKREMAEKGRIYQESVADLKGQLEAAAVVHGNQETALENLNRELATAYEKVASLENALGSGGIGALEVKIPTGDDGDSSDSSGESSGGSSSFVVIEGTVGARALDRSSRDPMLTAQAALVAELQDRHKDATDEVEKHYL